MAARSGTASEGMDNPAEELLPLVKDLAERSKCSSFLSGFSKSKAAAAVHREDF